MANFVASTKKTSRRFDTAKRGCYAMLILLWILGCGGDPDQHSTHLGNGCMHLIDRHLKHGIIVDASFLDGEGKHYYPKTDGAYCDRIAVAENYVFGEVVKYTGDSVQHPGTLIHYFAFCTSDKSCKEFDQLDDLQAFAENVGVESIPEFTSLTSETKPLYW